MLLGLVLGLMVFGAVAVAAGSPATARRLSTTQAQLPDLYFFTRHLVWQALGIATMIGVSMLSRDNARRFGVVLAVVMTGFLFLVPLIGTEVNGARRWLDFGMRFQPSEFLKPAFAIFIAWILRLAGARSQLAGNRIDGNIARHRRAIADDAAQSRWDHIVCRRVVCGNPAGRRADQAAWRLVRCRYCAR